MNPAGQGDAARMKNLGDLDSMLSIAHTWHFAIHPQSVRCIGIFSYSRELDLS